MAALLSVLVCLELQSAGCYASRQGCLLASRLGTDLCAPICLCRANRAACRLFKALVPFEQRAEMPNPHVADLQLPTSTGPQRGRKSRPRMDGSWAQQRREVEVCMWRPKNDLHADTTARLSEKTNCKPCDDAAHCSATFSSPVAMH